MPYSTAVLAFALLLLTIHYAHADEADALDRLMAARSLRCEFPVGVATDWDSGSPIGEKTSLNGPLVFDSIDHKANSARLIGNVGASDLLLLATVDSLTFIEVTSTGNVNVTTVFSYYAKRTRDFIVVHSRHVSIVQPFPSQYHGTCEVWQ